MIIRFKRDGCSNKWTVPRIRFLKFSFRGSFAYKGPLRRVLSRLMQRSCFVRTGVYYKSCVLCVLALPSRVVGCSIIALGSFLLCDFGEFALCETFKHLASLSAQG